MGLIVEELDLEGVQESLIHSLHNAANEVLRPSAPFLVGVRFGGLFTPLQNVEHVIAEVMGIELHNEALSARMMRGYM